MIPKETAETLKLKDPITPKFYMLLIIHKISNPGRPVVSSIGCHSEVWNTQWNGKSWVAKGYESNCSQMLICKWLLD